MIDKNINRFCELVELINAKNTELNIAAVTFYDGGTTFEECYASDIKKIEELQAELKRLLRSITTYNKPLKK